MILPKASLLAAVVLGAIQEAGTSGTDPQVDRILSEMERVGAEINDLKCAVLYKVVDTLNFDEYTKHGQITYRKDSPNPKFLIEFHKRVQSGVVNREREWWLFDGLWLWEANEAVKQVTKREICRAGETLDLFNIETAPFPVPFGQKKAEILKHFEVSVVPSKAGDPAGTDHLRCIPKSGLRMTDDYDALDYYVRQDLRLPQRIVATEKKGLKVITSEFPELSEKSLNSGLSGDAFDPPAEWKKFGPPVIEPLPKT